MRLRFLTTCAALLLVAPYARAAVGPAIDWDPAYTWETGASVTNSPPGGEFKLVGIVSQFGPPLDALHADDPTKEYTFYVHGLISQGTVVAGPPATTFYTTNYTGGTFELYEDLSPESSFDPNPPNLTVPANYIDGTLLLKGNFTSFTVQSNNFTAFDVGNIEGNIIWTGGTLLALAQGPNPQPCPGLFTGGSTWYPAVLIPGYIYRHDGKIDFQCPVSTTTSTWGSIKALYR
jgi:hypothetical protein